MKSEPGTYILILRCKISRSLKVGRWGKLEVRPGYYLYVGSAFGPGGVKARVSRHARTAKALRWHVDYLREVTELEAVWYSNAQLRLEHEWAQMMNAMPGVEAVKGFGCSDCSCEAHLFFADREPVLRKIEQSLDVGRQGIGGLAGITDITLATHLFGDIGK